MSKKEASWSVRLADVGESSLIERWFPYRELSQVAQADRRAKDPKYSAHTWWARRPPGVFRGILLAAALQQDTSPRDFWKAFKSPTPSLQGLRVADDFAGGGTTVVEASRLGADAFASDVDPLAVEIVKHQLATPREDEIRDAAEKLLRDLRGKVGPLFGTEHRGWTTLHSFYLRRVTCPRCQIKSPLYRDLVLSRDLGKPGSVSRDVGTVAFCPDCLSIHQLDSPDRKQIRCCGRRHRLTHATYWGQRFHCPHCGAKSSHRDLKTATAPRILLAVEETRTMQRMGRRFRSPSRADYARERAAAAYLARSESKLVLPSGLGLGERSDDRPRSYGISRYRDLFSDRQLALFGHAFAWIRAERGLSRDSKRAITLALSSALSTNNLLCGYARDYGRLSPLFSIRGYSLPALAVELNPLQPYSGRGTLPRTIDRVCRSTSETTTRHFWSHSKKRPVKRTVTFERSKSIYAVELRGAEKASKQDHGIDLAVFDPPYFDYIAYDELSEFFRAWRGNRRLGGVPLLPDEIDPIGSFSSRLSECLESMWARIKTGRPMVFSFHSASADAWKAIGAAIDSSGSLVSAIWPVKTDSHMGHHSHQGNCEWDLVVVIRRREECVRTTPTQTTSDWIMKLEALKIQDIDKQSMRLAVDMIQTRFGHPR